jgi:hypothetical protein
MVNKKEKKELFTTGKELKKLICAPTLHQSTIPLQSKLIKSKSHGK